MSNTYILLGIRVIPFQNPDGSKGNKHELVLANYEGDEPEYQSITGWTSVGMCGSGYRAASWGNIEEKMLEKPGSLHYVPKEYKTLEWDFVNGHPKYISEKNVIFEYLYEGCNYYPHGEFTLQGSLEEDYISTGRMPVLPMLHVFYGDSALGKSTIAALTNKAVYESDSANTVYDYFEDLPEKLDDSILVLGNKHDNINEQIEDIKTMYSEIYKLVFVNFSH